MRKISILITLIVLSLLIPSCIQKKEEKVLAIEVNVTHYMIKNEHVIKINSLKKVEVELSKIRITNSPPFPGIHAFAIYRLDDKVVISPIAYEDIKREGNFILYLGLRGDELPENNTRMLVIVEVRDERGKLLASDKAVMIW